MTINGIRMSGLFGVQSTSELFSGIYWAALWDIQCGFSSVALRPMYDSTGFSSKNFNPIEW